MTLYVQEVKDSGLEPEIQIHQFPYADYPWVEFFGSKPHIVELSGYLTSSDGYASRDALAAAVATRSAGELIHPSFGSLNVACVNSAFSENADHLGLVGFTLQFVECAAQASAGTSSSAVVDTQAAVSSAAGASANSFSTSFQTSLDAYALQGSAVTSGVVASVNGIFANLQASLTSPTSAISSISGLDYLFGGTYTLGRYAQAANAVSVSIASSVAPQAALASAVTQILTSASASRGAIATDILAAQSLGYLI